MQKNTVLNFMNKFTMEIILIFIFIVFSLRAPGFFTVGNQLNILRNISMSGIIAFAMTMVIIMGEIDLSVGSLVAFCCCVNAYVVDKTMEALGPIEAVIVGIIAALVTGALSTSITALMLRFFKIPTFITSLAMMSSLLGLANLLTTGFPINSFPQWYSFFGSGYIRGVPFPAIIFLFLFLIIHLTMKYTTLGRSVYAIGGNAKAATVNGIPVKKVRLFVYIILGIMCGISSVMLSSQIMSGTPSAARGWELEVIASVIIGGTALSGGAGRIWGTLIGVAFLGIIMNGMTLLNINEFWQYVVRGALILAAILLNNLQPGVVVVITALRNLFDLLTGGSEKL